MKTDIDILREAHPNFIINDYYCVNCRITNRVTFTYKMLESCGYPIIKCQNCHKRLN